MAAHELTDVVSVEILQEPWLRLTFEDGFIRSVDISQILHPNHYRQIVEAGGFSKVFVDPDLGTIAWPNGIDIDPGVLRAFEATNKTPPEPPARALQ